MATHSSVLARRIPGTGEAGGLPSMGSHRVGHDWNDLAAAAAVFNVLIPDGATDQTHTLKICLLYWDPCFITVCQHYARWQCNQAGPSESFQNKPHTHVPHLSFAIGKLWSNNKFNKRNELIQKENSQARQNINSSAIKQSQGLSVLPQII